MPGMPPVPPELQPLHDIFMQYNTFGAKKDAVEMDGRTFAKFCRENKLLVPPLLPTDCDLIFSSVIPTPTTKKISFGLFMTALEKLVQRSQGALGSLSSVISTVTANGGPKSTGTVAEPNKFHDDKSLYTGQYKHNDPNYEDKDAPVFLNESEAKQALIRKRASQRADLDASLHADLASIFQSYCSIGKARNVDHKTMDSRSFVHMLKDVAILNKNLTSVDADIAFTGALVPGERTMTFKQFAVGLDRLAQRSKGVYNKADDLAQVIIRHYNENGGAILKGTVAEFTKWHDDKSTYTGAYAAEHGVEKTSGTRTRAADIDLSALVSPNKGEGSGKPAKALWKKAGVQAIFAAKLKKAGGAGDIPDDFEVLRPVFNAYCKSSIKTEDQSQLDGRSFAKLCKELNILKAPLRQTDCDLVFAEIITNPHQKKISFKDFLKALGRLMVRAQGALGEMPDLIRTVADNFEKNGGQKLSTGTVAQPNKFHDDKSLYTGVYKNGGPTNVDLGTSDLKYITNRGG